MDTDERRTARPACPGKRDRSGVSRKLGKIGLLDNRIVVTSAGNCVFHRRLNERPLRDLATRKQEVFVNANVGSSAAESSCLPVSGSG